MTRTVKWLWTTVFIAMVVSIVFVWFNRYTIFDAYVLRSYTPSPEIVQLAKDSGMNETGAEIFYSHVPKITEQAEFNSVCTSSEATIVLGCYTGFDFNKDTDIYIYNVQKPELAGIKEVTASHEMLHAAYDRLSPKQRQQVDEMTATMVTKINNPRILQLIKGYQDKDPSVVPNEMHSILGTEVASLDPQLEQYYRTYFSDRQKVVALSESYEAVFDTAKSDTQRINGDLALRKSEISQQEAQIGEDEAALLETKRQLEAYRSQKKFAEYNALVPSYNQQVEAYNQKISSLKQLIAEYNKLVQEYNSTVDRQQDLVNSIDSKYQYYE